MQPSETATRSGLILGIESSCDETAAAVVRGGREVLSNVVASQMQMHALYGGVVPELASREHLRNMTPVVRNAVEQAGVALRDLDAIAVTAGPGLAGALLVGISYAKSIAYALGLPLIAVNHLEGHVHAVLMQQPAMDAEEQVLALVVSGGHTHLYLARFDGRTWSYRNVGRTVDDAAGEAYDKVAKLLGLGYPGGPWIDALAPHGDAKAVPFRFAEIKRRDLKAEEVSFDFSFSGIKTAVLRYVENEAMRGEAEVRRTQIELDGLRPADLLPSLDAKTLGLIASFQNAVVWNLTRQTLRAAEHFGVSRVLVSGGVAANKALRRVLATEAKSAGIEVAFPSLELSTDNAAMIAAAAWPKLLAGQFATEGLNATPQLRLG